MVLKTEFRDPPLLSTSGSTGAACALFTTVGQKCHTPMNFRTLATENLVVTVVVCQWWEKQVVGVLKTIVIEG